MNRIKYPEALRRAWGRTWLPQPLTGVPYSWCLVNASVSLQQVAPWARQGPLSLLSLTFLPGQRTNRDDEPRLGHRPPPSPTSTSQPCRLSSAAPWWVRRALSPPGCPVGQRLPSQPGNSQARRPRPPQGLVLIESQHSPQSQFPNLDSGDSHHPVSLPGSLRGSAGRLDRTE